jgi:hypothetical protein
VGHFVLRTSGSRILVVGAYRAGDLAFVHQAPQDPKGFPKPLGSGVGSEERHPLTSVVHEFQRDLGDILVDLDRAGGRPFVEALLDSEPNRLGASWWHFWHRGPLFQATAAVAAFGKICPQYETHPLAQQAGQTALTGIQLTR